MNIETVKLWTGFDLNYILKQITPELSTLYELYTYEVFLFNDCSSNTMLEMHTQHTHTHKDMSSMHWMQSNQLLQKKKNISIFLFCCCCFYYSYSISSVVFIWLCCVIPQKEKKRRIIWTRNGDGNDDDGFIRKSKKKNKKTENR